MAVPSFPDLYFTTSGDSTWYTTTSVNEEYYCDGDAVHSGETSYEEEAWLQTIVDSDSTETFKFYWKVSCQTDYDYLEFYIDDTRQDRISGEVDWTLKSYSVSAGPHTLKWRYIDGGGNSGDNCGWVDFVQWTGPSPDQDPEDWETIAYKYDVEDRRSEKKINGYSTRYVYDSVHVIAEYDGNNNLLRKYIYSLGVDEPVSMVEVADANATYYYHLDALGSVIALSDSDGDTTQTYEYSVYGEVAVEDANHTNPYMFTGRRYDIEIGLYYNRARYYNPYTGRFLQTDPIGYEDGMNMYAYCKNDPLNNVDPDGMTMVPIGSIPLFYISLLGDITKNHPTKKGDPSAIWDWTHNPTQTSRDRVKQIIAVCGEHALDQVRNYETCRENAKKLYEQCKRQAWKDSHTVASNAPCVIPIIPKIDPRYWLARSVVYKLGVEACKKERERNKRYCTAMLNWCSKGGEGDKPTHTFILNQGPLWPNDGDVGAPSPFPSRSNN